MHDKMKIRHGGQDKIQSDDNYFAENLRTRSKLDLNSNKPKFEAGLPE